MGQLGLGDFRPWAYWNEMWTFNLKLNNFFCHNLISTLDIAFSKFAVVAVAVAVAGLFFFFFAFVLEAAGTNGSEEDGARPGMEEFEAAAGAIPGM